MPTAALLPETPITTTNSPHPKPAQCPRLEAKPRSQLLAVASSSQRTHEVPEKGPDLMRCKQPLDTIWGLGGWGLRGWGKGCTCAASDTVADILPVRSVNIDDPS